MSLVKGKIVGHVSFHSINQASGLEDNWIRKILLIKRVEFRCLAIFSSRHNLHFKFSSKLMNFCAEDAAKVDLVSFGGKQSYFTFEDLSHTVFDFISGLGINGVF